MPYAKSRLVHEKKGPVHVWTPAEPETACDLVVFVHGFDLKGQRKPWYADNVVADFAVEKSLQSSYLQNATLCVIESKVGSGKPIYWRDLGELVSFLEDNGVSAGGAVHAIGHSGAFANIALWLGHEALMHVTLLDATYGKFSAYAEWAKDDDHWLDICVSKGGNTHKSAWSILKNVPGYWTWNTLPGVDEAHAPVEILYHVTHRSHMSWVMGGGVLPFFLTRGQHIRDLYTDDETC